MRYTDVIWDFNGTILDDVAAGIKSVNKMLSDRGFPTIKDKEHYRKVFRFPIIEYYRALGFDFDAEPYDVLAPIWVAEYLKNSQCSPIREGFAETFEFFKRQSLGQYILSATELNMLKEQLESLGIAKLFDGVYGLDNIHAHSKTELAVAWRREHPDSKILFIGDTKHDYDTAVAMGADCALVCGGHQERAKLEACPNAMVFESFEEMRHNLQTFGS
jgi:phosphoglycolate phosphatase